MGAHKSVQKQTTWFAPRATAEDFDAPSEAFNNQRLGSYPDEINVYRRFGTIGKSIGLGRPMGSGTNFQTILKLKIQLFFDLFSCKIMYFKI